MGGDECCDRAEILASNKADRVTGLTDLLLDLLQLLRRLPLDVVEIVETVSTDLPDFLRRTPPREVVEVETPSMLPPPSIIFLTARSRDLRDWLDLLRCMLGSVWQLLEVRIYEGDDSGRYGGEKMAAKKDAWTKANDL